VSTFQKRLGSPRALIGVIHVGALPGTPSAARSIDQIIEQAVAEAAVYRDGGPEIVAAMTAVACAIKRDVDLPLGVQVLAGANREAIAIAHASGADFVRVEGFVFAHVADEGVIQSCAGDLLRYRRQIGADRVLVFADIKKKHSAHAITADVSIVETAEAAAFFQADGVIVTGASTGVPASPEEVDAVARQVHIPVLVGSGLTAHNLPQFAAATGYIVGSSVKQGGRWDQPLDRANVEAVATAFARLGPIDSPS
jgi:membrane complex biogenesis BtpA family protein